MLRPTVMALLLPMMACMALTPAAATQIWSGARQTFTKANYADYTAAANQDRITTNVWLTRKNTQSLFNYRSETGYISSAVSPAGTEWAYGTTAGLPLTFKPFVGWNGNSPSIVVGSNAVLHLIADDIYLDIKFIAWTSGGGGGLAYERAGAVFLALNGASIVYVKQNDTFNDPNATATDSAGNALTVDVTGAVDTATLGTYVLTYTTTDSRGYTASATRTVAVVNQTPIIWNGPCVTFTKANYADYTSATNQDRITTNIWLTRQDNSGLFNIYEEAGYNGAVSPLNTTWAFGSTSNLLNLSFQTGHDWVTSVGGPENMVGSNAVLHLPNENTYIDIRFTAWTPDTTGGGGFSYERAKAPASIALNGAAAMRVLLDGTFDDPGATAMDAYGTPLTVTISGTLDTATLGTYTLTYRATARGYTASVTRQISVLTSIPIIWNGPRVTFTKADYADWMGTANQDRITTNVWLTRQDSRGLFNIKLESSYNNATPSDTEWAFGTTSNLDLTFQSWHDWARSTGGTPSIIGREAVVHLIAENIYIDIKFTSWTSGESGSGGGFSYERAKAPASITLAGAALLFVQQGGTFVDPGASATALDGTPLTVTAAGSVDTAVLGTYVLIYSATADGYTARVTRKVRVVANRPEIWNGQRIPFAKKDHADYTLPENQDRITTNVWLTRQDSHGLFNIKGESAYNDTTPSDTEWAFGTTSNLDLTFQPWHDWARSEGQTPSVVGRDAVVHLISEDIYIDIKYTSWTSEGQGGGFSYERAGVVFLTRAGNPSMATLLHTPFVDPGVTALDLDGNPLTVVTNGTVDADSLNVYTLTYTAVDAKGHTGIAKRLVRVLEILPQIWNGPRITFTKTNNADWTDPACQDRLTPGVWLTRQATRGLFNIAQESSYGNSSPSDTEWAYGTTSNLWDLSFNNWNSWARSEGQTPSIIGHDAVVHLIAENIYIDVKFTNWTSRGNGGGFAYERAKAFVTVNRNGTAETYAWLNSTFADPGATAVDCYENPLNVTTNGTVDTGTAGDYQLTYSATDTLGHADSATRTVHVVADFAVPQISMMPSYSQNFTYANTVLNVPIMVWGRAWNGVPPYAYTLDYGDGSEPMIGTISDPKFIGQMHAYSTGGSKTAPLSVTDGLGRTVTRQAVIRVSLTPTHDLRVNMAIEKGLLWIYRHQSVVDTSRVNWPANGGEYDVAAAGFNVQAMEENGHLMFNDDSADIYAETVRKGLNWLLNNSTCARTTIAMQTSGDPDSNGNGKGAYLYDGVYANGIGAAALIMALPSAQAASNTVISGGPFNGLSYFTLVQDIFDQYSYCQGDGASGYRGGWRYSMSSADSPAASGGYDGSSQQWPNINFMVAMERWGLRPAQWVIDNSLYGFAQIRNNDGSIGYNSASSGPNLAKTGGSLTAYKVGGMVVGDAWVNKAILYVGSQWQNGWAGDFYAMYGAKKGLFLQEVTSLSTPSGDRDWYNDMSAWLLGNAEGATPEGMPYVPAGLGNQTITAAFGQAADGSWLSGNGYMPNDAHIDTPVAVLILTKTVTVLMPVAAIAPVGSQPAPLPEHAPIPFAMNASSSYHQDSAKSIVEYLWDWDSSDGVDWSHPDATGPRQINPGYASAGTYTVTLRVKDNSKPPLYATKTITITVTDEPLPPVAVAIPPGHPAYAGRIGAAILLDGSTSYDPNGGTITNYTWDLNGNGIYGDAGDASSSSPTITVQFASQYVGAIGLQVAAGNRTGSSLSQINIYATSNDLRVVSFDFVDGVSPALANVHAVLRNDAGSSRDFDDVLVRFYNGNPLTSGAQISSNYYMNLPRGVPVSLDTRLNLAGIPATNIYVYVDADDAIPESDELNNVAVLASVPRHTLTLSTNPSGAGAILSAPTADGDGHYAWGTTVGLTATPSSGWSFTNWSGDIGELTPTNNPIRVTIEADLSLIAIFTTTNTELGGVITLETNALSYSATYASTNPVAQTVGLTNVGMGSFTYTNVIVYSAGATNWLTSLPTTGTLAAGDAYVLTNSVNIAGLNAGTYYATNFVTATDATNAPQCVVVTLVIARADQTLTFPAIADQLTTNTVGLSASATSGLPPAFSIFSGAATITGGTNLTFTGAGAVTVVAAQSGNANWNAAANVTNTFNVTKAVAGVTLSNLVQVYNAAARSATVNTTPTGLTVAVTYNGNATAPTNAGLYAVNAMVIDAIYQGNTTGTLSIAKADQTITFPPIAKQAVTNTVLLSATALSGLTITFSVDAGPTTLSGGTNLSFNSAGHVIVRAAQSGDSNWNAATDVTHAFDVIGIITNVTPGTGTIFGGTQVTISGLWLGNGSDITNVTLCNIAATIMTQGLHSVTVISGISPVATQAHVVVQSSGFGAATLLQGFTYQPLPPAPAALSAIDVSSNRFTARWAAAATATHYLLDVSTTNTFASYTGSYQNWNVGDATACLITGLVDRTTYYYRLRAANGFGASTNSNTIEVPAGTNTPFLLYEQTNGVASAGSSDTIDPTTLFHGRGLHYTVVANSNPGLVSTTFDGTNLVLHYTAGATGTAQITIRATDTNGFWVDNTITVSVVPAAGLTLGPIVLNRQNGLYEQLVTVMNNSPFQTAKSVTLTVTDLTTNYTLYNATGRDPSGNQEIQWRGTLAPLASMPFTLQYYSAIRGLHPSATVVASISLENAETTIGGTVYAISGMRQIGSSQAYLIEFPATPGRPYYIQYTDALTNAWKTVYPGIIAPVNRMQWIDSGPPGTECAPGAAPSRYYRVIEPAL